MFRYIQMLRGLERSWNTNILHLVRSQRHMNLDKNRGRDQPTDICFHLRTTESACGMVGQPRKDLLLGVLAVLNPEQYWVEKSADTLLMKARPAVTNASRLDHSREENILSVGRKVRAPAREGKGVSE